MAPTQAFQIVENCALCESSQITEKDSMAISIFLWGLLPFFKPLLPHNIKTPIHCDPLPSLLFCFRCFLS